VGQQLGGLGVIGYSVTALLVASVDFPAATCAELQFAEVDAADVSFIASESTAVRASPDWRHDRDAERSAAGSAGMRSLRPTLARIICAPPGWRTCRSQASRLYVRMSIALPATREELVYKKFLPHTCRPPMTRERLTPVSRILAGGCFAATDEREGSRASLRNGDVSMSG